MRHTNACKKGVRFAVLFALATAGSATATVHDVIVRNFEFAPADIAVAPGDTVRWAWESGTHTVTSGTPCTFDGVFFDAPMTSGDPEFEFVIPDDVDEIPYFCRPHCGVGMWGSITVSVVNFLITVDGGQFDPFIETPAAGSGTATLDTATNLFSWEITFADLEGTQTAAHFHGPAPQCADAGVQVGLSLGSPIIGSTTLTPEQAADVLAGLWYVNIHTDLHPDGEIRGQVMPVPLANPVPDTIPAGSVHIELATTASELTAPNWGTAAPGIDDRLVVTDQNGTLWNVDLATGVKTVLLDVSAQLVSLGVFGEGSFDERGLLGVAFHPDYATNGLLYTYMSQPVAGAADFSTMPPGEEANHQAVITEWTVPDPANPSSVVDPGSARELLRIDEPQFNHNAGALTFGPDGMLYISLGDGGGADDKDGQGFIGGVPIIGHGCIGNGTDNTTILGSLLRIDPLGSDSENGQYGIPPDNPFVGVDGLDEIFAHGFRNPFRFSFDALTGELYVADVGQNDIEEINVVTSGGHYGWNHKEGTFFFVANGNEPGYVSNMPLSVPSGLIDPIAQYDHDEGIAIVGGFVYRGTKIPALAGRYVFGDFAQTFSNDGRLFYLDETNAIQEFQYFGQTELGLSLLGFGQDAQGELYVLANSTGTPFDTTGVVLKIKLRDGDIDGDGDVDLSDLAALLAAFNTCVGDPGYNPAADFDDSGCVDLSDLALLLAHFGT